jgi:hypothetical protein
MPSTYTTNLRLTKQADGENPNSWGQILNEQVISLVDEAVAGYSTVAVGTTATVTLTNNQGSGDQARSAILEFTGTIGGSHTNIDVLIPPILLKFILLKILFLIPVRIILLY